MRPGASLWTEVVSANAAVLVVPSLIAYVRGTWFIDDTLAFRLDSSGWGALALSRLAQTAAAMMLFSGILFAMNRALLARHNIKARNSGAVRLTLLGFGLVVGSQRWPRFGSTWRDRSCETLA